MSTLIESLKDQSNVTGGAEFQHFTPVGIIHHSTNTSQTPTANSEEEQSIFWSRTESNFVDEMCTRMLPASSMGAWGV